MSPRPTLLPEQLAPRRSRFRSFRDAFCRGPRLGLSITSPDTRDGDDGDADAVLCWHDDVEAHAIRLLDRLALAERVASLTGVAVEYFWPSILTWSLDQVAEVERWLVDSTAEMPELFEQWAVRNRLLSADPKGSR